MKSPVVCQDAGFFYCSLNMRKMDENYFAVIPLTVMRMPISANAKLLFGEITALTKKDGECVATNKHFSEVLGVSERTVSNLIAELIENYLIKGEIEQDKSGTWRTIYPIFQWGGRKNRGEGVEASFVPKESNTNRVNTPDASDEAQDISPKEEIGEDMVIEAVDDDGLPLAKKRVKEPKTRADVLMRGLLRWAEERRGAPFPSPAKQLAAMAMLRRGLINVDDVKERWIEMENDDFYKTKGFDFMTVVNSFNKKR